MKKNAMSNKVLAVVLSAAISLCFVVSVSAMNQQQAATLPVVALSQLQQQIPAVQQQIPQPVQVLTGRELLRAFMHHYDGLLEKRETREYRTNLFLSLGLAGLAGWASWTRLNNFLPKLPILQNVVKPWAIPALSGAGCFFGGLVALGGGLLFFNYLGNIFYVNQLIHKITAFRIDWQLRGIEHNLQEAIKNNQITKPDITSVEQDLGTDQAARANGTVYVRTHKRSFLDRLDQLALSKICHTPR